MEYWIDWDAHTSIHNWVEQLDLICYPKWHIGCVGSAFFAGWASTILVFTRLADVYGRKYVFIASVVVDTIMMVLMMFVSTTLN